MTDTEITQEAVKLFDINYLWSTVIAANATQLPEIFYDLNIYVKDIDQITEIIQNWINKGHINKLRSVAQRIKFDYTLLPPDYPKVVAKFQELQKNYNHEPR